MSNPQTTAAERLTQALIEAHASPIMIANARKGVYGDFYSYHAMPITQLIMEARAAGLHEIVERAKNGDFDGR